MFSTAHPGEGRDPDREHGDATEGALNIAGPA
jgi:hypothetical protein